MQSSVCGCTAQPDDMQATCDENNVHHVSLHCRMAAYRAVYKGTRDLHYPGPVDKLGFTHALMSNGLCTSWLFCLHHNHN